MPTMFLTTGRTPAAAGEGRAQKNVFQKHEQSPESCENKSQPTGSPMSDTATRLRDDLPKLLQHHTVDPEKAEMDDVRKLGKRSAVKNELIAAIAELCGTFLFLFFAFGIATRASRQADGSQQTGDQFSIEQLLYASLGSGFSLAVSAWTFYRISGGLFNPAVTLGLYLIGTLTWYRSLVLVLMQFIGAISAAGITQVIVPGGINVRTRLNCTVAQGFLIEMICTFFIMFTVYMLATEKHKATFIAPVGLGLALFVVELFALSLTGGSLNPARTLGPDVIAASFDSSTWIYYTAPFVGTTLSAGVYKLLKESHYETVNVGREDDYDGKQARTKLDENRRVASDSQRAESSEESLIPKFNGRASHHGALISSPNSRNSDHISIGVSSTADNRNESFEKTEALGLDPAGLELAAGHTTMESDYAGIARRDMLDQAV